MEKSYLDSSKFRKSLLASLLIAGAFFGYILLKRWRRRKTLDTSQPLSQESPQKIKGLSEDEVQARIQPDIDNSLSFKPVRSRREIWHENVLSIFNLSLVGLALVQLLFGRPLDALISIGVLGLNIGINVFQEYFARHRLRAILLETRSRVTVIRDHATRSIDADELVIGDMVAIGPGDELLADGKLVYQNKLVIDESMMGDGNRRAVKEQGDTVFAGSFCISGHAVYQVEKTGADRYITQEIKNSSQTGEERTPIEIIIGNVLRILLAVVVIFTGVLIYRYLNLELPISEDLFNEVAGIIFSIAPAGLFFMIVVTYAASTVDLAKFGALVHRARSVEAMAQVNTICFSREGVLTGTKLDLSLLAQSGAEAPIQQSRIQQILGDYVRSSTVDNKITDLIQNNFPGSGRKILDEAPYLSIAGWSAIKFDDPDLSGTYLLGVPAALEPFINQVSSEDKHPETSEPGRTKRILSSFGNLFRRSAEAQDQENDSRNNQESINQSGNPGSPRIENQAYKNAEETGKDTQKPGLFRRFLSRVSRRSRISTEEEEPPQIESSDPPIELIFAYHPDPWPLFDGQGQPRIPIPLTPLCKLSITEQIRPESVSVLKSFWDNGIEIKIFTAEHPGQVIDLLRQAGINDHSLETISGAELSLLGEEEFARAAADFNIFLNPSPEQTGQIVAALREQGQYVVMTGDAVNDVPALRQANLAAAYQSSSPAAQSMADILLLENSLLVLERVLDKGQRIVNGLLDILKLYLAQVFYLSLMILGVAIIGIGFPLRGIQLTVITTVTITIPALGLTLWANPGVLYGNSLRKSLSHFIIPVAITIAIAGIVTFFSFNDGVLNNEYAHLAVTYTLVFTGLLVVLFLRPPFRLLVGGAPLSRDRRILSMVIVLTVLFLLTVALTSAISFLQNLLLLQWLHPLGDFLTILVIVIVWAIVLLLIWRIWRSSGIWDHQGASPEEAIGNDPQGIPDQSSEK